MPGKRETVQDLLDAHGETFAEEIGIDVAGNTPSPLFRLLVMSMLYSARMSHEISRRAAEAVTKRWRSSGKLLESTWDERVEVLNEAGYTRYQERTATMLGELAEMLEDRWGGDLRRLREEAGRDPRAERRLLKEFKGLGDVGADIFFREIQVAWDEVRPFLDERAKAAAKRRGLGADPSDLVGDADAARLAAALVRSDLES